VIGKASTVRESRPTSEDEVVLAFLRGELDSARFGADIRAAVVDAGGIELVTAPDLTSAADNAARRSALAVARGWGRNERLFAGFPNTLSWTHGELEVGELERIRYIDYSYWTELSGGSRRPADVRAALAGGSLPSWLTEMGTQWCFDLADILERQGAVHDLIVVGPPEGGELVLLEGHARLTALFVGELQARVRVSGYLGTSPDIHEWRLY
jgi:hypothetical protein